MATDSLRILYRDSDLICCVKEPGIISESSGMPALISRVTGEPDVYTVHRLDRDTGGVMVYALNRDAAAVLSGQFSPQGDAAKTYLAVLEGAPDGDEGTLTDLLFHDRNSGRSYVVDRMRKGVREASLSYKILSRAGDLSLVRVSLHSGRTHQIRVQFSSRSHPVAGDRRYGSGMRCPLALWAAELSFSHPVTGERLSFRCSPPSDSPWDAFGDVPDAFPEQSAGL
jgi:23S rRNA pseudouridine1911/1915/1917 synthase